MRFPTREVMDAIREMEPDELLGLPRLSREDAWLLDEFLEKVHDALWLDYGEDILAHEDFRNFPDLDLAEDPIPEAPAPANPSPPWEIDF